MCQLFFNQGRALARPAGKVDDEEKSNKMDQANCYFNEIGLPPKTGFLLLVKMQCKSREFFGLSPPDLFQNIIFLYMTIYVFGVSLPHICIS